MLGRNTSLVGNAVLVRNTSLIGNTPVRDALVGDTMPVGNTLPGARDCFLRGLPLDRAPPRLDGRHRQLAIISPPMLLHHVTKEKLRFMGHGDILHPGYRVAGETRPGNASRVEKAPMSTGLS